MYNVEHLEVATGDRGDRNLILNLVVLSLLLCLAGFTAACGAVSQSAAGTSSAAPSTALSISPGSATVASMERLQFTARVRGTSNTAVTWSASAGTISSSGFFTAPKVNSTTPVIITATSAARPVMGSNPDLGNISLAASVAVTVTPVDSLAIASSALQSADAGMAYTASLSAIGGVAPYQWSLVTGALPSGIRLQTSSGVITGMTALTGSYPFTAKVTDASGHSATTAFTLTVSSSSANRTVLSIFPVSTTLASQAQQQFFALIGGTADAAVTWSASAGTISSSGFFTAPKVTSTTSVTITATSVANASSKAATATATVTPVPPQAALAIVTSALAGADAGMAYTASLSATGGVAPYQWSLVTGALPSGIRLQASSGVITGMTALTGSYPFTAKVTDASGHSATTALTLTVSSSSANGPVLSISPVSTTLASQAQQQFSALISGTADTAVTWSASAGTISSSGAFTAPKVTSTTSVTITATSVANASSKAAVATATVTPVPPQAALAIVTSALAGADAGMAYTASLSATGGVAPYQWSLVTGALPSGIRLQASSGVITGMTALTGSYPFTAKVTDASGHSATTALTLTVSSSSANGFDGPAELPRIYIQSAMSNTPAPGSTITVNSGGNLQSALNSASCGDTIQLQAGATFSGTFTFPAKTCDDNHWIVVRTSADDSALPAESSRLNPCYAGVSSLPGRPTFNCASTNNVLAKLVMTSYGNSGVGPILFAAGANHYRLVGLEVTRAAGIGITYALASVANGGTANNLILDRVWMHGTAQDDTTRAVDLSGTTYVSVVDSFLTDFHCVSLTGTCGDSQAISGGIGNGPMGPYKITNNFLEAAGENILFGGGTADGAPTDIQVSQNHMFKPLTWMKGQPGYVGGANGNPFTVKNLFELKNAQRVLLEGNIMENSWGGFSQVGFGVLITPKNQSGSMCPVCLVTDVTIRYSSISHVAGGLQIANALADNLGAALDGQRYSIHDIVIDDIDGVKYGGPGEFAQVSVSAGAALLQNVNISHITAFPSNMLFVIGAMVAPMKNFVFTNSIVNAGATPIWSTGGGVTNCAFHDIPLITFNTCFSNSVFTANVIIGTSSTFPSSKWPSGNYFPASAMNVDFVNYNGGIGGDYHLQASSPYKNKGTDSKDLGADIDALNSAIASVE